ncbi:hypothetical protein MKW92_031253 [Papaver armeniacum]|nr:hypothetical protein MKW92_031253 [Papaver armeniacum]
MAYRFFSIIHAAIIERGELALPKRFVGKFRTELSMLRLSLFQMVGVQRVLELRGLKVKFSLGGDGNTSWIIFLFFVGHFSILRYDGNSRFHIFVCDMSATEIKYPLHSSNVEISSHTHTSRTRRFFVHAQLARIPLPASRIPLPTKKRKKKRVERETNVFKSRSGNLTFKIVMQLDLCAFEGRTWDVGISTYREKHTKACDGWSDFVLDNRLEVGDVCIFEMIDGDNLRIDVTIMRARDVV